VLGRLLAAGPVRRAALRGSIGFGLGGLLLSAGFGVLVTAVLYILAGVVASRRAWSLEAGLFAGMIAGATAGITRFILAVVTLGALRAFPPGAPGRRRPERLLTAGALASGVVALILDVLDGTALGALGGLVGRGSAPASSPPVMPYQPYLPYPPGEPNADSPAPNAPQKGLYVPSEDLPPVRVPDGGAPTTPSSVSPRS
jgi:hypothetical protein